PGWIVPERVAVDPDPERLLAEASDALPVEVQTPDPEELPEDVRVGLCALDVDHAGGSVRVQNRTYLLLLRQADKGGERYPLAVVVDVEVSVVVNRLGLVQRDAQNRRALLDLVGVRRPGRRARQRLRQLRQVRNRHAHLAGRAVGARTGHQDDDGDD